MTTGGNEGAERIIINVQQWLQSNKLSAVYNKFQSRNISIEEIIDFEDDDIKTFAKETLELDILGQRRFVKAIQKIKYKNKPMATQKRMMSSLTKQTVIISSKEQECLTNLYQRYDECSKQQTTIQKALNPSNKNSINEYEIKCINDINNIFNEIIEKLIIQKNQLLQHINDINVNKQQLLKQQLNTLQNQYIPSLKAAENKYQQYAQGKIKNFDILNTINKSLNNGITVLTTQPKIEFNTANTIKITNKFLNLLKIDDCDRPFPPTTKILKVGSNSIIIAYDIQKQYYKTIGKPILKICIEYAIIKNDELLWMDYKEEKYDTESSYSDSDSDSDTYKKKRKQIEPTAKMKLINISLIKAYKSLKWVNYETKISKKNKKYDRKYKIEEKVKDNKTYIIRMKLLNESGWGEYLNKLYVVKTPKMIIDTKILTYKEKVKLKKLVNKQTNNKFSKWKLLYRASKDGFTSSAYFNKCDRKINTICVLHSNTNNVFGGFCSVGWDISRQSPCGQRADPKAFLYLIRSIDKKKKAEIFPIRSNESQSALYQQTNYFLMFGSGANGFFIADKCNQNTTSEQRAETCGYEMPQGSHLNNGVKKFMVKQIEVFQLKK